MPRRRLTKPWLHSGSGYYCTYLAGKRVYLDRDYRAACKKLRELKLQKQRSDEPTDAWLDMPYADLADAFLDDLKARKKPTTYDGYRQRLRRALGILGIELRVVDIRKHHLAAIERELTKLSPTTVRDTIAAVQSVFGWAVRCDLLDTNPLAGYEKPAARMRNRVLDPGEFRGFAATPAIRRFVERLAGPRDDRLPARGSANAYLGLGGSGKRVLDSSRPQRRSPGNDNHVRARDSAAQTHLEALRQARTLPACVF